LTAAARGAPIDKRMRGDGRFRIRTRMDGAAIHTFRLLNKACSVLFTIKEM
jgi:hypothetical protein